MGVGAEVGVGGMVETKEKGGEKEDGQTTNSNASDGNVDGGNEGNATYSSCIEVSHKTVRFSGQVCSVCGGKGHSAKICANVVTVFACEADTSGSDSDGVLSGEEQDAFVCDALGKSFDEPGKRGRNALAWQMGDLPVIYDNGASCHISHSSTGIIKYREANATMRKARGKSYPIEGYGDLPLTFRSSSGEAPLLLCDVVHASSLSYHPTIDIHTYTGKKNGVRVKFSIGETLDFPSVGRLNFLYAYRPGARNNENTNAVIASGPD